jgi:soluble lytic murein transglycosylase-like protein
MTKLDKALFAFASYNAGPAGVASCARKPPSADWIRTSGFHNVEYVAAEKIGPETVTYVSNIYKYYIAYKLIMEQKADREEAAEKLKSRARKVIKFTTYA